MGMASVPAAAQLLLAPAAAYAALTAPATGGLGQPAAVGGGCLPHLGVGSHECLLLVFPLLLFAARQLVLLVLLG